MILNCKNYEEPQLTPCKQQEFYSEEVEHWAAETENRKLNQPRFMLVSLLGKLRRVHSLWRFFLIFRNTTFLVEMLL